VLCGTNNTTIEIYNYFNVSGDKYIINKTKEIPRYRPIQYLMNVDIDKIEHFFVSAEENSMVL